MTLNIEIKDLPKKELWMKWTETVILNFWSTTSKNNLVRSLTLMTLRRFPSASAVI